MSRFALGAYRRHGREEICFHATNVKISPVYGRRRLEEAWQRRGLFSYKECQDQPCPRMEAPCGGMAEERSVFISGMSRSALFTDGGAYRRHGGGEVCVHNYKECQDQPCLRTEGPIGGMAEERSVFISGMSRSALSTGTWWLNL